MKAVAYLRVSTRSQGDSKLGLESQLDQIQTYCQRQGLELAAVHQDVISGGSPLDKRDGWLDAMADLEPGDQLVVAKRDRIARDTLVSALAEKSIQDKKARIVSAAGEGTNDEDPTSVLMRKILDAFSEYERLQIRARTRGALKAKKARNEKTGGDVPFGYDADENGHLIPNQEEQLVIAEVLDLRDREGFSFQKIADFLNDKGIKTKTGKHWNRQNVNGLYKRVANG
jgi:DNA invertase Pin-like site-specific DNA recombinase